jgi:hypothetical protein
MLATAVMADTQTLKSSNRAVSGQPMVACDKSDRNFVCGASNAEDLIRLPGTQWVIASHLPHDGTKGPLLQAIDIRTHEVRALYPASNSTAEWDAESFPECPSPSEPFASVGLNFTLLGKDRFRLYVANAAPRASVEIVDITFQRDRPIATWRGCILVPKETGAWPNAVVPLPDGGVVVSGNGVAIWHQNRGWQKLAGFAADAIDGNGVEVSRDGRWLYVNGWADSRIVRVSLSTGEIQPVLKTTFHPDNLRWGDDGGLYVTGANSREEFEKCFDASVAVCDTSYTVMRLDTNTGTAKEVLQSEGIKGEFGAGGTALQIGDRLWMGGGATDRIAIFELKQ